MAADLVFNDAAITVHVAAVNVYGNPPELMDRLGQIAVTLQSVQQGVAAMTPAMQRLTDEVTETRTSQASIIALVAGLAQQIRDAVGDEDALNALADSLDQGQTEIAQAVADNTPATGGGGTPEPGPNDPPAV